MRLKEGKSHIYGVMGLGNVGRYGYVGENELDIHFLFCERFQISNSREQYINHST